MKLSTTLFLVLLGMFFWSCSNNSNTSNPQSTDPAATAPTSTPLATASIQHYICPNNCVGSGGSTAGNCPVCGSEYLHNDAYHNQPQNTTSTNASTPVIGGVQHYICPNNCAGSGGGAAGNCPVCGSAYVHNAAYHDQQNTGATTSVTPANDQSSLSPLFQTNTQQPQVNVPRITSAANTSGVYHYVCSKGCSGGSGMAGACPSCGSALVHNQAYHQ